MCSERRDVVRVDGQYLVAVHSGVDDGAVDHISPACIAQQGAYASSPFAGQLNL